MDRGRDAGGNSTHPSCSEFPAADLQLLWKRAVVRYVVIKSLDHWPDLGSDLDLYTDADAAKVVEVMSRMLRRQTGGPQLGRSPRQQVEFRRARPA